MARMTKILLVDDSKFLRLATERALTRAGYEVSTATDGANALEMAREKKPDLILLDMLLPRMTGPDVLKALKRDPATAGIAVVAFTGLSQKNAERLEQDGTCAFLDKSELGLDLGSEALLVALARIVRRLKLEVPGKDRQSESGNFFVPALARLRVQLVQAWRFAALGVLQHVLGSQPA